MALSQEPERKGPSHPPTPDEFPALYASGLSMGEIAKMVGRTRTFVRKRLLKEGVKPRTREEGTALYKERHPESHYRWKVADPDVITDEKLLLMTMILTEGCINRTSIYFANTQEILHQGFRDSVRNAYGDILVGKSGLNSRICASLVVKDLAQHLKGKKFSEQCLGRITESRGLCIKVCRIIADTEGAMIISAKKAPRNYTVEFRVVLASSNAEFRPQVKALLSSLGIESKINRVGVHILKKDYIKKFVKEINFTPGLKVIRKKAGYGVWFGKDKSVMTKVFLWVSDRQDAAWGNPKRFLFADCVTREQTVERLMSIYRQVSGG